MPKFGKIQIREYPYSKILYRVLQKALLGISVAETNGNTQAKV